MPRCPMDPLQAVRSETGSVDPDAGGGDRVVDAQESAEGSERPDRIGPEVFEQENQERRPTISVPEPAKLLQVMTSIEVRLAEPRLPVSLCQPRWLLGDRGRERKVLDASRAIQPVVRI